MEDTNLGYINFIKAIAMLAVLVNHIMGGDAFYWHSIFSVGLFIIVSGITCGLSLEKGQEHFRQRKILRIAIPYIIASGIYVMFENKCLDVRELFLRIINFDATGPTYFVLFYMELILIAPVLYKVFVKMKHFLQVCLIIIVTLGLSWVFLNYTTVSVMEGPFLGSKYLFGGTYFFEFCIGMLVWIHREKFQSFLTCGIVSGCSLAVILLGEFSNWPLQWWSNPPNRYAILYTISVFFVLYSFWITMQRLFGERLVWEKINLIFQTIGKYSLIIFLYHILVRDYFVIPYVYPLMLRINPYIQWSIAIFLCTIIPIAGAYGFTEVQKKIKQYLEEDEK